MKRFSTKFLLGTILIVGFFVYVNALPNGFVWDDEEQIVNNTVIREWQNLPLFFTSSTFYAGGAGLSGGFYRPLVSLSYFLNYQIWGLIPLGFRLFQIIFHLLNLVLIFFILRKIFNEQKIKYGNEISTLATLLFTVHPANVESVIYLASLGEVLYTFFGLLSFWFFLKLPAINYKNNCFLLGFLFAFLGLFAKESALVIFPIVALYFFIFIKPKLRFWLNYTFGTLLSAGIYLFLRLFVAKIPAVSTHFAPISQASLLERLTTIPYSIFSYLKIIFFPKDLTISHQFIVSSVFDIRFWGPLIFLIAILSLAGFYIWKAHCSHTANSKLSAFWLLWFFVSLFPTLNIIPLEMTIAERWLYFPLIGFLSLVSLFIIQAIHPAAEQACYGARKLPQKWRKISYIFLILIILSLSARTISRAADWKNGLTLFGHDVQYSKDGSTSSLQGSFDLENNYGVELFRAGRIDEAETHFRKSIELQPKWTYPHNNLGAILERRGNLENALAEYKKSAELSDYYLAYENIGGILFKMRKYEEAKDFLLQALQKFPRNANLKWQLALVYLTENDTQKATSLLFSALQDDPQNVKVIQLFSAIQQGIKIEF